MCSQETKILQGKIFSDSIPPNNIHIINLNLARGTTSDSNGDFEIVARPLDTLLISSVQFQRKKILVSKQNYIDAKISIFLIPQATELDEIQLSDLKLSGFLQEDVSRIRIVDRSQFGIPYAEKRPTQAERHLYTASSSAGGIPLDLLINTINGKIKMLKKVKANDELSKKVEEGLNAVGVDFFTEDLELDREEVINFIYYCAEDQEFLDLLALKNNLGLIKFYKSNKYPFLILRGIEKE